jgi:hypothetical protein
MSVLVRLNTGVNGCGSNRELNITLMVVNGEMVAFLEVSGNNAKPFAV